MLRFMKNKILIPLVIIGALAAFFSFKYSGGNDQSKEDRRVLILETVTKAIKEGHYAPREINDSFSDRVFTKFLEEVDAEKKFFTQADINDLQKYQYLIDDEIRNGSIEFYNKAIDIYLKRQAEAEGYSKEALKNPFTFTGNEVIQLSGDKLAYAADDKALLERWKELMKYRVLARYTDLKKEQEKNIKDKKIVKDSIKTDAKLEADAREYVVKNQQYYFKGLKKIKEDDRFAEYVNTITSSEDPHTDYFPPKQKQSFDEMMSGTFYGIGAQLKSDAGKVKIASVITGSPCWKQGELKAGDEITKVAQGAAEPKDVEGLEIEDVVQLIRGKKGTEVRLTVKKANGSVTVIPIIRGEVLLDYVFAKSAIINSKEGPVGYISLPEFYTDFQHINGRRCSEDVAIEVQKLKNAGVVGIILDLRYNGGGSLSDVVDMAGLFVGKGPVVQVKSSDAAPMTLRAPNKAALYDGPMAVMINQGSASASEIMAAALQDYKRAVIVGSTSYGKGTVQKIIPLDEFIDPMTRMRLATHSEIAKTDSGSKYISADPENPSIGSLKITVQKFYRVSGGSTQLKGVTPDIILPDPYSLIEHGERQDKAALKWDEIPRADYVPTASLGNLNNLIALSNARVSANPTFGYIKQNALRLKKQNEENSVSLNEKTYRKELDEANETYKKIEELQKKTNAYEITNPKEDLEKINVDSSSITKNTEWIKNLKKDIYISETINIVNDMAKSGMKVSGGKMKNEGAY